MAWVKKRGKVWYLGYIDERGKGVLRASKAISKEQARLFAQEKELQCWKVREGLTVGRAESCSWDEFCDRIEKDVVPLLRSPGTLKSRMKHHLRPAFSGRNVSDVRPEDVQALLAQKKREGYAPQGVEHIRRSLRKIFNHAIEWGLCAKNPASEVERVEVPETAPKYLERGEIARLVDVVPSGWRTLVLAAICLGVRKGELLGLRRRNINLVQRTALVAHSYDGPTKTGRPRTIAIPEELVPFLEEHLKTAPPSEYLFCWPDGSRFTKDTNLVDRLRRWLARAGIDAPILWKDLRSTFGTHAAEQVDLRFVQQSLGHRDIKLTDRTYSARRAQALAEQAKKLRFLTDGELTEAAAEVLEKLKKEGVSVMNSKTWVARDAGVEPATFGSGGHDEFAAKAANRDSESPSASLECPEEANHKAAEVPGGQRWPESAYTELTRLDVLRCAGLFGFKPGGKA